MKELTKQAYHSYMRVVHRQIDRAKELIKALPELEKVSKLTYEEWKEWQSSKSQSSQNKIKFSER